MKTKIVYNSVNIEFFDKIHVDFWVKFSMKTEIAHNSVNIELLRNK